MKKLVMAAAVLGAFAGAAQAQTSVTLYGIADGNLRFDHTNLGTLKSVGSGGESGSRWGLRGTEDLGGGLKANFIFEQGFDLGDNSVPQGSIGGGASAGFGGSSTQPHSSTGSRIFGRIATVGLSGSYGEVRFGRGYNPLFLTQATADPFGAGFVSQVSTMYVNNTIRNDNAVYYDSPRFAGIQVSGVYQFGESSTDSPGRNGGAVTDRSGEARQRPLRRRCLVRRGPAVPGRRLRADQVEPRRLSCPHGDAAATYDFGFLKLHAIFWKTKNDNPNNAFASGSTVALNEHVYTGGITVPFGAWTFLGQYSRLLDHSRSNVDDVDLGNPKSNNIGLGFRYSLSKRTILYFGYAQFILHNGPAGNAFQGFAGIADASNSGLYAANNLFGAQNTVAGSNAARITASGVAINRTSTRTRTSSVSVTRSDLERFRQKGRFGALFVCRRRGRLTNPRQPPSLRSQPSHLTR